PYRWATIGKELSHIEHAQMADVRAFFDKFYVPSNAIMVVAGNVQTENVLQLVEKWFLPIPSGQKPLRELPPEPEQKEPSREVVHADVPLNSIYIAFHAPGRTEEGYHVIDLISDLLSQGPSSRLYRCLVKEQEIFSEINAYQMGSIGPNLF